MQVEGTMDGRRPPAVKICGLTNLEDARHAWRAGADLLGFVLVPGTPRCIALDAAAVLVRALRSEGCDAVMVGVFAYRQDGAHRRARPTAASESQRNHGRGRRPFGPPTAAANLPPRGDQAEDPSDGARRRARPTVADIARGCGFDLLQLHGDPSLEEVAGLGLPTLIARRVQDAVDWASLAAYGAWGYVLDGYDPHRLGGTGKGWDWRLAADRPGGLERVVVAGGLTPDNVAEAIRLARPWGVDVSSGVEAAPGRKDPERVTRFIERVKGVTL